MSKFKKLEVGQRFKNYKDIVVFLNEEVKAGKSKQLQIKEWERHFSYEKQGNSFVVLEVYEEAIPKVENRGGYNSRSKHVPIIERLILELIADEENELIISRTALYKELRMVGKTYFNNKKDRVKFSNKVGVTLEELNDFYTTSDDLLKRNLNSALDSLRKQALIHTSKVISVLEVNNYNEFLLHERYDEDNQITTQSFQSTDNVKKEFRLASDDEVALILEIERKHMLSYECRTLSQVFNSGKRHNFYKGVREELFNRSNIANYYESFKFIFNNQSIKDELEYLDDKKREEMKKELLVNINSKAKENAVKRNMEAINDYSTFKGENLLRIDKGYVSNQHKIADQLLK